VPIIPYWFVVYAVETSRVGSDSTGVDRPSSAIFRAMRSTGSVVIDTTSPMPAARSAAWFCSRSRIWSQHG